MDQNPRTLNPVQSFNPPIESDVNLWPQLLICDPESANASHLEYPSFKKPRTSQATMVLRMDQNPRTLNPIQRPIGSGVNFWPQLLTCDQESANASHLESASFKKPRTHQATMVSRMDQNPTTLNPFQRPIESGVNFWPQLLTCDQESANGSHLEYPSFKKPRTPETTMVSRTPMLVNKPTPGFRFKSELCLQFKRGNCSYGEKCNFAHGNGEFRNWYENQEIITTMRLCRWYCNGEKCPFGERCHFLHEELAKFRKSGAVGPGRFLRHGCDQLESLDAYRVSPKPVFWKTRLCNKWEATGYCPYGVNCTYAHGHAELQKFGSQTAMDRGNGSASKMIPTVAMHASPCRTACGTACEQKMQDKKCSFKWKGFEKISHIYADWIDDMPLVHSSMGKVES